MSTKRGRHSPPAGKVILPGRPLTPPSGCVRQSTAALPLPRLWSESTWRRPARRVGDRLHRAAAEHALDPGAAVRAPDARFGDEHELPDCGGRRVDPARRTRAPASASLADELATESAAVLIDGAENCGTGPVCAPVTALRRSQRRAGPPPAIDLQSFTATRDSDARFAYHVDVSRHCRRFGSRIYCTINPAQVTLRPGCAPLSATLALASPFEFRSFFGSARASYGHRRQLQNPRCRPGSRARLSIISGGCGMPVDEAEPAHRAVLPGPGPTPPGSSDQADVGEIERPVGCQPEAERRAGRQSAGPGRRLQDAADEWPSASYSAMTPLMTLAT